MRPNAAGGRAPSGLDSLQVVANSAAPVLLAPTSGFEERSSHGGLSWCEYQHGFNRLGLIVSSQGHRRWATRGTERAAVFPGSESRKFQGPNTLPADGSGLEDGRVRFPGLLVHSSDPINHP
jgi:hypothetical protein